MAAEEEEQLVEHLEHLVEHLEQLVEHVVVLLLAASKSTWWSIGTSTVQIMYVCGVYVAMRPKDIEMLRYFNVTKNSNTFFD